MTEVHEEPRDYSSHKEQILDCQPPIERVEELEKCLLKAYESVIAIREVPFILFEEMNAEELAEAFLRYPIIIKATLCCVNVAQRAIKRDLGFDYNTYSPSITDTQAKLLAGYIKPFLPRAMAVPALMELDRFFWTDKEMRARKGNWEKAVTDAINDISEHAFRKRRFECDGEEFEIDAAFPSVGKNIEVAIDVKRIESMRDIHKRADEIINKATKFKKAYADGKFIAVVYYPFPNQHINLQSRLHSSFIDEVFFAGETPSSIAVAVDLLVGGLHLKKK
jgi:hypothetical protein